MKIGGVLLLLCSALVLLGLAASGTRASGYWPTKMPEAERRRRALSFGVVAPVWAGIGWFCLAAGAFVVSHYNWSLLAVVACIGLTQAGFVTWSLRRARRRAASEQASSAP